jgi:microcystin-dependent protein
MSDAYVAEIRIFAGNFPPKGWAFCDGQLLAISQNTALFSLLGTSFGGDGRTTFALPDLRGRVPIGQGQGPGLTSRNIGETGGQAAVALTSAAMPAHNHLPNCNATGGGQPGPAGNVWGKIPGKTAPQMYSTNAPNVAMATNAVAPVGGGQPHNNKQPYLGTCFIIALQGIFPPRS